MPNNIRATTLLFLALWGAGQACAGALDGDLFGYRLGAKYPVTNDTRGRLDIMGAMQLLAEKPDMPPDFERVELIATAKTFTIGNIYGVADFKDEESAKSFELRYADLLDTMYGTKCAPLKAYLEEKLKLLCAGKYVLTVHRFKPGTTQGPHRVHIGLQVTNESAIWKQFEKQFKSEIEQLENEAKKARLEQAQKDKKLKGLQ